MLDGFSRIKNLFELFLLIKKVVSKLKQSPLFLKETSLSDIVEKHFSFEQLPKGEVVLTGKLSNFTISDQVPVYSPRNTKGTKEAVVRQVFNRNKGKFDDVIRLETNFCALSVPAISQNIIRLDDGSRAKIIWLYNEENNGLVFNTPNVAGGKLVIDNLQELFSIKNENKPIPVLVDTSFPVNELLYRKVKIKGKVVTAPSEYFDPFANQLSGFTINYFSNCFRSFSNNDGVLAIDVRTPYGKVESLENKPSAFSIVYTVQGIVDLQGKDLDINQLRIICTDSIPDRQGMRDISSIAHTSDSTNTILTIGDISWQCIENPLTFAAFITLNASDNYDYQTKLAKLASHWQVWQKECRSRIRKKYNMEPKITPVVCTNFNNERSFHPNGLQISKDLEQRLLNSNPEFRQSIDWIGVSIGK